MTNTPPNDGQQPVSPGQQGYTDFMKTKRLVGFIAATSIVAILVIILIVAFFWK
jgi:hypothetical protein